MCAFEPSEKGMKFIMYIFNVTDPITVLLLLAFTILLIFLGKEIKNSFVTAVPLFAFLIILSIHAIQFISTDTTLQETLSLLTKCMTLDFIFVLLSFLSYLWIDDVESKFKKKKSIDDSLEWFWRKV